MHIRKFDMKSVADFFKHCGWSSNFNLTYPFFTGVRVDAVWKHGLSGNLSMAVNIYIYIIIQRVKARAIPCPHQPPTRGDNTDSVAQGGTATPGTTKQLLPPDRVLRESYIYIYIYIYARSIKCRDYIGR